MSNQPHIGTAEWESLMRHAKRRAQTLTKNDPESEDIAQEAMAQLLEVKSWPDNPEAWLSTTIYRRVADLYRARKRKENPKFGNAVVAGARVGEQVEENDEDDSDRMDSGLVDLLIEPFLHTSHIAIVRDMIAQIQSTLSERELLLLTGSYEGLSNQELADMFGYASAASVRQTIMRARQKIDDIRVSYRNNQ